ncbi:MAG: hypothetical protein KKA73_02305 [Chloroflexi bacterium]|nr:hypothetical protein [Chloroflexota bacterium]
MNHANRPDQRGQGLIEYAILLVMVSLVMVAGIVLIGPQLQSALGGMQPNVAGVTPVTTPLAGTPTPTPERVPATPTPADYARQRDWPFFDDFSAGSAGWQEVQGSRWRVENGRYGAGPGGEHRSFAGDEAWTDYTVTVSATLAEGNGYGMYFRATGWDHANAYIFQYDPGYGQGAFLFRKIVNGAEQEPLASEWAPPGFDWYDVNHQIMLVVRGNTFTAYVDGQSVLTAHDDAYSHGGVGLRTWDGSNAWFDNVAVGPTL